MSEIKPIRIQRKRAKGFNLQTESKARNGLECVYVGRPTRWGNPYKVGDKLTVIGGTMVLNLEWCLFHFKNHAVNGIGKKEIIKNLRGKNLACFCKEGEPCHADILLELANKIMIKNSQQENLERGLTEILETIRAKHAEDMAERILNKLKR